MGITWREAIANIAFSLLFAILPLVQPQLALNTVYPPVGCPHWGICANNTYDPSYTTYYQCFPNFCVCNDGTTDDLTLTETYYYDELTTQPPSFQRCATVTATPCASHPCPANSDCSGKLTNYMCTCWANFTGADCNETIAVNACSSSPCQNGASCVDNPDGTFNCTCASGYTGELCEFSDVYAGCYAYSDINSKADCNTTISAQPTVDSCRTIFQNSLLNIDSSDTYYCVMGNECGVCEQNPFAGKTLYNDSACNQPCGTEANYNTTKGSGKSKTTTTSWGLYSYKGANESCGCSGSVTVLQNLAVQCGGLLQPGPRAICYKYSDYQDPIVCNSTTPKCLNGGICVEQLNDTYTCTCPRQFSGSTCDTPVAPCSSNPCKNSATCTNSTQGWSYVCICAAGWTGPTCSTKILCHWSPCANGGLCIEAADYSGYTCECPSLYTGANCNTPNMCYSSPCKNGANCTNNPNGLVSAVSGYEQYYTTTTYSCTCMPGWTDYNCDKEIDFCESTPCFYQGTCLNFMPPTAPYYNCTCQAGTFGQYCETNPDNCVYSTNSKGKTVSTCNATDPVGQCIDGFNTYTCVCGPDYTSDDCSLPMIVYNATILIFGPGVTVSSDIINLLDDLLSNPSNIVDMVPFILGLETESERMDMSWDYSDMFEWVAFEEKTLQLERDLYKWNDVTLGNCFTFNHRNNTAAQYLGRMTGATGGLLALLKVNSDEYCPWTQTMGIQVFVHPAEEDIFSASVSTTAQPGTQADLFPFMTAYTRLGGLYGTCVSEASQVKQYFYTGAYSTDGCLQSCYQQACEDRCQCMDPRYPMPLAATPCNLTQRTCVDDVTTELGDPSTWASCVCPNACSEREYDVTWMMSTYSQRKPQCNQTGVSYGNCSAGWADTVRVAVIMTDYTYQLFAETPAESLNSFIGNLGGLLGVLMGVSTITFIEVGFLFVAIMAVLCSRNSKK